MTLMAFSLHVEHYTHGCRISGYEPKFLEIIGEYLKGLKLVEPETDRFGRVEMVLKKRFFGLTHDRQVLYLHRHHLPDFLRFIEEYGYVERVITHTHRAVPKAEPLKLKIRKGIEARDYQIPLVSDLSNDSYSNALYLQTGGGKQQPLSSKIKIPGGWSTMGDMKVGTEVTAWDGTTTQVTAVHPQGVTPFYRVTFWDGRYTDAGPEHLWKVFYVNTVPHRRWRTVDTLEVKRLCEMPNPRVYIPLCKPEDGPAADVKIPPYSLGVILGDGGISNGVINITKLDDFIFDEVLAEAPEGSYWNDIGHKTRTLRYTNGGHPYRTALKDYGLWGRRSWEKFIPKEYLHGSLEQRYAILQGLMDTDGTVDKPGKGTSGTVSFCSTSRVLAAQVQYLVRSVGGIASISERNPTYTHNGEKRNGRIAYQVNIRHPRQRKLFRLPRKRDRLEETNQYSEELKLRVRSVEYIGDEPTQCITIAHPDHLYVTDDFIVTHNSLTTMLACVALGMRFAIMIPPKYFDLWVGTLNDAFGKKRVEHRYYTIDGSPKLKAFIRQALEGKVKADCVMISNATYRAFLNYLEENGEQACLEEYGCLPTTFHEVAGIGVQINDEIQEDPGLYFRIDLFSNVRKIINLSATPFTGNDFVTGMINVMLPEETHCQLPEHKVYQDVIGLLYNDLPIHQRDFLVPMRGMYSHMRYESQMLKNKPRFEAYIRKIVKVLDAVFVREFEKGHKALVLCATVAFIDKVSEALRAHYKQQFAIGPYYQGIPYNKLLKQDITVSTAKSSGTGVDVRNLKEVVLLHAMNSKKDNLQILGRLRPLKDFPEVTPRMCYFVCVDIPHHLAYHRNKKSYFHGKVKSHRTLRL
jgi:hypothetical protein